MIINSGQGLSCNKFNNFSKIISWKHFSGSAIILVPTVMAFNLQTCFADDEPTTSRCYEPQKYSQWSCTEAVHGVCTSAQPGRAQSKIAEAAWQSAVYQKSRKRGVCERGVAQICRKLRAKFAQNCRYFVSYIRGRVRKIVANLSRI